jgi:hypothetical protein
VQLDGSELDARGGVPVGGLRAVMRPWEPAADATSLSTARKEGDGEKGRRRGAEAKGREEQEHRRVKPGRARAANTRVRNQHHV